MSETTRMRLLKIFLRVWAVASIAIFGFIFIGYAMHASAFRPGAGMHWAVWDDLPGHVAMMLAAIYLLRPRSDASADAPREAVSR